MCKQAPVSAGAAQSPDPLPLPGCAPSSVCVCTASMAASAALARWCVHDPGAASASTPMHTARFFFTSSDTQSSPIVQGTHHSEPAAAPATPEPCVGFAFRIAAEFSRTRRFSLTKRGAKRARTQPVKTSTCYKIVSRGRWRRGGDTRCTLHPGYSGLSTARP